MFQLSLLPDYDNPLLRLIRVQIRFAKYVILGSMSAVVNLLFNWLIGNHYEFPRLIISLLGVAEEKNKVWFGLDFPQWRNNNIISQPKVKPIGIM